ncbi:DGQHR domain-containing protein [Marinobacter excellens]|jgi:DNA phosphorothioation-associated DGQHR protein 1|uniref:TgtA5 cluster protein 1 n=1 Tax=Marinobacter excellens LAMA 842 TaxID=1306954 RepID=A0A137S2Z1_9GAMM|nr:DGQHR domain-containing protein [Marinobacter excellens]KXO06797.1 tgtA5 cluster protein 1 [Marinobacter excellens LAMA 842]
MPGANYLRIPALRIRQPLGDFFSVVLSASDLEKLTYSARARYERRNMLGSVFGNIAGNQRKKDEKREKEIARFIDSNESAFPNSIILGANYEENGLLVQDENERWHVERVDDELFYLCIPTNKKMACIIDGQHRLAGFEHSDRKDMDLLCSVYLDLPAPYQAYIFATININQKKVDKSLAYELYGFNLSDEDRNNWSPEKLAVYIARVMRFKRGSLIGKISLGVAFDDDPGRGSSSNKFDENKLDQKEENTLVSLSTIVDGILSLISSNPRKDRDDIQNYKNKIGRKGLDLGTGTLPLREKFILGQDEEIEDVVVDYMSKYYDILVAGSAEHSYLRKTVGFIGSFAFLKDYLKKRSGNYDGSEIERFFEKAKNVDFSVSFFSASAVGSSRIRSLLLLISGLKGLEDFSDSRDYAEIVEISHSLI